VSIIRILLLPQFVCSRQTVGIKVEGFEDEQFERVLQQRVRCLMTFI
jgi:hypothetical protein